MPPVPTFDAEKHKYYLDGEEVPSVSEVTRFLAKEVYESVDENALELAAEKGTAVHKATEKYDKSGSCEIDEYYAGYMEAYKAFRQDHDVGWELIEDMVYTDILLTNGDIQAYAGTIDRYGVVDDVDTLLDIKTTKSIGGKHKLLYTAAQNLYAMALEAEGRSVKQIIILQLKEDGSYKIIKLPIDSTLSVACLTLHSALNKTKRKGKTNNG